MYMSSDACVSQAAAALTHKARQYASFRVVLSQAGRATTYMSLLEGLCGTSTAKGLAQCTESACHDLQPDVASYLH
jgi:hypothetical protein